MNMLVIGGAGYIGSHVVRTLLDKGHSVTVYDNLSTGRKENLFAEARFVEGDILDSKALREVTADGIDGIIHLAAFKAAGESMIRPEKYAVNNLTGTINILNAAAENEVRRFVFSSSAAVYGEPRYLPIDEKHPKSPENFYGFTKLEIERLLEWYDRLKNVKFAALRYFNAAGYDPHGRIRGLERNPQNLLPVVMEVASGMRERMQVFGNDYDTRDGTCIRDYIHVSDLAEAHVLALEWIKANDRSLIVNLGSETGVTVKEMIEAARRITGTPIPADIVDRRPGDPAQLVSTAQFARETLGWKAKYSDVDSLVSSTWEVYRR
ncbi:MAG: UDP-glucose 4-epimerase GalE [Chitinivibrionales bacterium]|nr:UDP-glucose 4-epimerase GalE [Chitinivibrionales bacterium]MBD3356520.1 UDP-glucose 4-epimerase GalE [Chitinivibrionales bacterium]